MINDKRWQKIKSKIEDGVFVEMRDAGHLVPFDDPVGCAKAIKGILQN